MESQLPTPDQQKVNFHSSDIAKHPKPQYFPNAKKTTQKSSTGLKHFLFHGPRRFITPILALVVIAAIVATPFIIAHIHNSATPDISQLTDEERLALIDEVFEEYGARAGIDKFQEFIDVATSDEQKSIIHLERASALFARFDGAFSAQILTDAREAERLYPSFTTAIMNYIYERRWGNEVTAQEFLELSETRRPEGEEPNTGGSG